MWYNYHGIYFILRISSRVVISVMLYKVNRNWDTDDECQSREDQPYDAASYDSN